MLSYFAKHWGTPFLVHLNCVLRFRQPRGETAGILACPSCPQESVVVLTLLFLHAFFVPLFGAPGVATEVLPKSSGHFPSLRRTSLGKGRGEMSKSSCYARKRTRVWIPVPTEKAGHHCMHICRAGTAGVGGGRIFGASVQVQPECCKAKRRKRDISHLPLVSRCVCASAHRHTHMHIHMHAHMYSHVYTYASVGTHSHTCIHMYTHTHICTHVPTKIHTCIYGHTETHTYTQCAHMGTHINTYTITHMHAHIYVYGHRHEHRCMHTCTYTCIHITQTHMHAHTHLWTYTDICTYVSYGMTDHVGPPFWKPSSHFPVMAAHKIVPSKGQLCLSV
jgi:hypothetical protein